MTDNTHPDVEAPISNDKNGIQPQEEAVELPLHNHNNDDNNNNNSSSSNNNNNNNNNKSSSKNSINNDDENSSGKSSGIAHIVGGGIFRPATKAPKETLKAVYAAGRYKAGLKLNVLAIQSFMAGVYIASAGQLLLSVGGGILGTALFPGGLMAVVLTSAELFTGDSLIFVASVLSGEVKVRSLLRNWFVAWCSNFVGSLAWAYFMGYLSDSMEDIGAMPLAIAVAEKKAHNSLPNILIKGIGANFLVCIAIWQATCAEEASGKILAIWFPVVAFVAMGFDHCVANMYFIPMGMMLGADISIGRMFAVILVASLGNTIGGGIFVGAIYWYVFDSMSSIHIFRTNIRKSFNQISGSGGANNASGGQKSTNKQRNHED